MGHTRWRVRVAPNERTCCQCGETYPDGDRCPRCGIGDDGVYKHNPLPALRHR
jgi:predicted amidophosphoribosyltransferase